MKGLFTKDFLWLAGQKRLLLVVIGLVVIYQFTDMYAFGCAFVMYMTVMVLAKTIIWDLGSSGKFLFTLPFSRRAYVTEKYILTLGTGLAVGLIVLGITLLHAPEPDMLTDAFTWCALLCMLTVAVEIPLTIQFKEKSQLFLMILVIALCIPLGALEDTDLKGLAEINWTVAGWILAGVSLAALAVSWIVSTKLINKLEF